MSNLVYKRKSKSYITKEFTFDSAHNLYDYEGKCKNLHGHTYKLQVTITGSLNDNGILMDFNILKNIVTHVIEPLDHNNITEYFDKINGMNTTVENLCVWIYDKIKQELEAYNEGAKDNIGDVLVFCVKLWETPTCFATYFGETIFYKELFS